MKVYDLKYIVDYARENSPYHKELYKNLPDNYTIEDIPLLDQDDYWKSEKSHLTREQSDGHIFRSGGTTGKPKYSYYSKEEWETFCEGTAINLPKGGLKNGDKIANLFYCGALYASFVYTFSMLSMSPTSPIQYSLTGNLENKEIIENLKNLKITHISVFPSKLMQIIECIELNNITGLSVEVVYYAGEMLYQNQRDKICKVLNKNIEFRSLAYATNDSGLVGYFDKDCDFSEHRAVDLLSVLELIDEDTGEVITEKNRPGKLYITSLYRTLMPIIRYPVGDMAEYTEDENANRKFKLLGRSGESIRVALVNLAPSQIYSIIKNVGIEFDEVQLISTRKDGKDLLSVYIAVKNPNEYTKKDAREIHLKLLEQKNEYKLAVESGVVCEIEVHFCKFSELEFNETTGKLKKIIDRRQ